MVFTYMHMIVQEDRTHGPLTGSLHMHVCAWLVQGEQAVTSVDSRMEDYLVAMLRAGEACSYT